MERAGCGMCTNLSLSKKSKLPRMSQKTAIAVLVAFLSVFSAMAQTSSQATITYDSVGHGVLNIPGQGTQFDAHTASTVFDGTTDDQLVLGYNTRPNGGSYAISEPQMRLAMEADYNDGFAHNLEWNLDTVNTEGTHARRWMYLKVDRSSPMIGQWAFWGTYFSLQNYNSPGDDIPSEYFGITSDGIARLTSRSGQPALMQLNTTDSSGYPGSYTNLLLQRDHQSKWLLTNKGASGDTFAIVGSSGVVANFLPDGVFVNKGVRTSVTTKTASYTATTSDSEIRVDCSNGPITITLPAANATGQTYRITKIDRSANVATIARSGNDILDGAPAIVLKPQFSSVTLVDGAVGAWDKY